MSFIDRFLSRFNSKESQARIVSVSTQVGQPQHTPANYEAFARQGYSKNALVFRCISMISKSCGGIELELFEKKGKRKKEIETHPLLTLIERPNPLQSRNAFIESMVGFYEISGNTYIEAAKPKDNAPPFELWPARPDRMKIIPAANGYPQAYQYTANGRVKTFPVDFVKMRSDILHVKSFHPLNDWYGLSPLEAGMISLDQNNAAQRWNLGLLQNSATPSGVLQMKVSDANPRGELTTEQYARMRRDFRENYQGPQNAGTPMIIEGGLSWTQMSFSPREMEFLKGKEVSENDIARIYGIPPELLGLGQKTFNNYREARLAFYEETVLPTMDLMLGELNRWLAPAFGENLTLGYNADDIEALTYKREQKFNTVKDATFLTQNEKREAVGYEDKEGWDVFVIGNQIGEKPEDFSGGSLLNEELNPEGNPNEPTKVPDENALNKPSNGNVKPPNEDDDFGNEDGDKQWKSINLLNSNEKRQSWRRQNARKKRLQSDFERSLAEDLKAMNAKMRSSVNGLKDARLIEYALLESASEGMKDVEATLRRHIKFTLQDFGRMILDESKSVFGSGIETKANLKYDQFVNRYVETRTGNAITQIEGTTRKQVQRLVRKYVEDTIANGDTNAELSNELMKEFESLSAGRARTIARTEVQLASNNGSLEAVKSLQIPGMVKEWVSANDSRVRDGGDGNDADHVAMNGAEVNLDEKFGVPPDALMECPGDSSGGADQVINCRCVLVYKARG